MVGVSPMANRLTSSERQERILALLAKSPGRSTQYLAQKLGVSSPTIRRDIESLERRGFLTRIHGGATLRSAPRVEPLFSAKEMENREAKERIALRALGLVEDHDVIYLDGGSTVLMFARLLSRRRKLTIVTNSLMAASNLMESGHRLILVGGEFRALSRTLVGPLTEHVIKALAVGKAFMGTIGLTIEEGMTTTDVNEAFTKEQIMMRAGEVILLADHTKLGVPSFVRSGTLEDIDTLVTDRIDGPFKEQLEGYGIEIMLPEE